LSDNVITILKSLVNSPLFDAPQGWRLIGGTPFVPTGSEPHGAQDGSKAPPLGGGEDDFSPFREKYRSHLLTRSSTVAFDLSGREKGREVADWPLASIALLFLSNLAIF
jgi:hypothetical protein